MVENTLASVDPMPIAEVYALDGEQLVGYLKKLDVLKHALEVADAFREQSVEFAKREALALIRICELGGQSQLSGHRRKAAEWLFAMRDEARLDAISMCSDGLTIEQVWKREVKDKENSDSAINLIKMYERETINEFKSNGQVKLINYDKHVEDLPVDAGTRKALKDGLRNKIRNLGGHGLGDGEGTYLTPEKAERDFDEIVFNKVDSMTRDLKRLKAICVSENRVPRFDFGQAYSLDNPRILCLVIVCVMGLGKPVFASKDQAVTLVNNICYRLGIDYGLLSKRELEHYEQLKREKDVEAAKVLGKLMKGEVV